MELFRSISVTLAFVLAPALFSQAPAALLLSGDYPLAHDPSIAKDGGTYYVFTTSVGRAQGQLPIRCSTDLQAWKLCGNVFDQIPDWIRQVSPATDTLWAPDISRSMGEYRLYYAYSIFGKNISGIALATNKTLDQQSSQYHWVDKGLVLRSTTDDDYNAIDPNLVVDAKKQQWLCFGSFWSGIKMVRIDPSGGKRSAADNKIYALAARKSDQSSSATEPGLPAASTAIEAPFIVHHRNFYYLFVSFDKCCKGAKSTYRTMVGRSREVTGPYLDGAGKPMLDGGGTELLTSNGRWVGPGGESILQRPEGDIIVFHAYDADTGKPALQVSQLTWQDGWPHAALGRGGTKRE